VTEHERTAKKAVFLVVVAGLFVTCLLGLVLGVALIARGDHWQGWRRWRWTQSCPSGCCVTAAG